MLRAEHYREAERLAELAKTSAEAYRRNVIELGKLHAMLAGCPIEGGYPNNYGAEE